MYKLKNYVHIVFAPPPSSRIQPMLQRLVDNCQKPNCPSFQFLIDLMVSAKVHQNKPVIDFILASPAPIDTAVKIARSYELLSLKEKERAMELEEMSKFCDNLANELLSIAASNNNTAALLRAIDNRNTPFLDVLIELQVS